MNYFEFCDIMKRKTQTEKLIECTEALSKNLDRALELIEHQNERIEKLSNLLYKLAPEVDIIETLAESPEEETDMIDRYMNHGRYTE